jgi:hypothetical protein
MSNDNDKFKNSRRRHKDEVAATKQVGIAKQHGIEFHDNVVKQPHRLTKRHAMDCGNPGCSLCGNPRKIHKELTAQEKRLFQDVDHVPSKRSNGVSIDEEDLL